jgi:hypothetical protein
VHETRDDHCASEEYVSCADVGGSACNRDFLLRLTHSGSYINDVETSAKSRCCRLAGLFAAVPVMTKSYKLRRLRDVSSQSRI